MQPIAGQTAGFPGYTVNYAGFVPPSIAGETGVGSVVLRETIQIYGSVSDDTGQLFGVIDD